MKLHLIVALLFLYNTAFCQTLTPDLSFGNNGIVASNLSNDAPHFSFSSGKQSDGKIILGGSSLIRIFSNGNVDSSFGTNGMAKKAAFPDINSLAVQSDDKIICVLNDYSQVIIQRFSANGFTDSSFNGTGLCILSEQGSNIAVSKIRLQQDGKILVAGSITGMDKSRFFIARYLTDGTPDVSFNSNGRLTLDIAAGDHAAYDIAVQSTGRLIVGGYARASIVNDPYLAVIRLNNDGSRDLSFNGTGTLQYSNMGETAHLLQSCNDDKILVAGTSGDQLLLLRLLPEGTMDSSFSDDGILTEAGLGASLAKQVDILNDNSILVSGQTSATGPLNWQYAAFKFTGSGLADTGFNGNGKTWLPFAGNNFCAGSIILNDGSIVLSGYNDELVFPNTAHISSNGVFDIAYGNNGIKSLRINGSDETIHTLLKQQDNKLIAIGTKTDALASVFKTVVVKYNTNGTVDSSFGNNGIVYITEPGFVFHSAVLQADDKILMAGDKTVADPEIEQGICVTRLNTDGSIDNNFGNNGIALMAASNTSGYGKSIGLLSDGKIMVAGKAAENSDLIVVYRLLGNGTIDNDFASNGKRTIDLSFAENGLGTLVIQPDNKILLGGYVVQGNGQSSFFCMRLQANGDTDAGFASGGIHLTSSSTAVFLELNAVVVLADNKILLTGHVSNPSGLSGSVYISKLLPNGSPDYSFNGTGNRSYYWKLNNDSTFVIPNAVSIHPDNSIYIVGDAFNVQADHKQFIIRVKQNGLLDSTISTDGSGWLYTNYGGQDGSLNDIVINADSSIFIGGNKIAIGTNEDLLIAAYNRLPDVQGIVYVFTGDGLWTDAANWKDNLIPPGVLPNGAGIIIDPIATGSSVLNVQQDIAPGGRLVIMPGKKLLVEGNFKIGN